MLKVEHLETWGFEHAIRGMRNPMNSWVKSDSMLIPQVIQTDREKPEFEVGPNDLELMRKLYLGGTEHRKFMRQIFVSLDITAPLYWWKEFDTYKVGTVANSCSTMHKIHEKEFDITDFSHEHLENFDHEFNGYDVLNSVVYNLNIARTVYLETQDKRYWWQMIQLLPSSYNQKRTITMNYENAASIIHQRHSHKLDEWQHLVRTLIAKLSYFSDIVGKEKT